MGKVAEIKTKPTTADVEAFIEQITNEQQRKDSLVILGMMEKAAKAKGKMWGSSIIGFGDLRYKSARTGREVDWFKIGFSPRKANLTLYLALDVKKFEADLQKLGKYKTGVGCLYINKLADVDIKILEKIIKEAAKK